MNWAGRCGAEEVEHLEFDVTRRIPLSYERVELGDGIVRSYQRVNGSWHDGLWRMTAGECVEWACSDSLATFQVERYEKGEHGIASGTGNCRWQDGNEQLVYAAPSGRGLAELTALLAERMAAQGFTRKVRLIEMAFKEAYAYFPFLTVCLEGDEFQGPFESLGRVVEIPEASLGPDWTEWKVLWAQERDSQGCTDLLRAASRMITQRAGERFGVVAEFFGYAADWPELMRKWRAAGWV